MIYIVINGILVEAETVVQAHIHAKIEYHKTPEVKSTSSIQENDKALEIIRGVFKQIVK